MKPKRDEFDIGEWSYFDELEFKERLARGEKPGIAPEVLLWVGVMLFVGVLMVLAAVLS